MSGVRVSYNAPNKEEVSMEITILKARRLVTAIESLVKESLGIKFERYRRSKGKAVFRQFTKKRF